MKNCFNFFFTKLFLFFIIISSFSFLNPVHSSFSSPSSTYQTTQQPTFEEFLEKYYSLPYDKNDEQNASHSLFGYSWKKVVIPGAVCGDGSPYHVFMREGKKDHLAVGFMGGGACWNFATCIGPTPLAWTHHIPFMIHQKAIFSENKKVSILADWNHLFFPYCTGDVFVGDHTARYFPFTKIHHHGKRNVEMAFQYLKNKNLISFEQLKKVTLHGSSAGALGAIIHMNTVNQYLPSHVDKSVIADAPGLHFGNLFWHKFTAKQINDFSVTFAGLGLNFDATNGHIASQIKKVCHKFSDWRIGFLQGSKDIVMSSLFGNINPWKHDRLVFGETGLYQQTIDDNDDCSSWIPRTLQHTFLLQNDSLGIEIVGKSASSFIRDIVENVDRRNYRGMVRQQSGPTVAESEGEYGLEEFAEEKTFNWD